MDPLGARCRVVADRAWPMAAGTARKVPPTECGFVVLAAVAGAVLRGVALLSPIGRTDSDEVIAGLMARHIVKDGYPAFYWGQHYGGAIELAPVAVSQWLFGTSIAALRLPTIVLAVASSVLVWRIGRRMLSGRAAAAAGLLTWLGPPAALWFGVREQFFYQPTVVIGLGLGLAALRWQERPSAGRAAWAAFLAGLGLWTSLNIVYFLVPAIVSSLPTARRALGERRRPRPVATAASATALLLGVAPLLVDSVTSRGAPLDTSSFPVIGTYWSRLGWYFTDGFPAGLGLRQTFTYRWIGGPVGIVAYVALLMVVALGLARGLGTLRWDAVGLGAFPFIFACVSFGTDQPNLRYQFFVVPFAALVVARAFDLRRREAVWAGLALTTMFVLTTVGIVRMIDVSENSGTYKVGHVGDLGRAEKILDQHGIKDVFADYWVAYRITYDTDERIVAAPAAGLDRYRPYHDRVRAAPRSAWVVEEGFQLAALRDALGARGVEFEVYGAGDVAVVIPAHPVLPDTLPLEARAGTRL